MGSANSLHASGITASIMRDLIYLCRRMATDDRGCSSETLLALSETVRTEFKKIRDDPSDIKALLSHERSRAISLTLQPLQRASTVEELGESMIITKVTVRCKYD